MRLQRVLVLTLCLLTAPAMLIAHPGHSHDGATGMLHPLAGWDHLLALLALGIWFASRLWASSKSDSPQSRKDARSRPRE